MGQIVRQVMKDTMKQLMKQVMKSNNSMLDQHRGEVSHAFIIHVSCLTLSLFTLGDKLSTMGRALACTSKLHDLAMQHSNSFHLLNNAELNVLLYRPYIG
jgi:hypothetical protein